MTDEFDIYTLIPYPRPEPLVLPEVPHSVFSNILERLIHEDEPQACYNPLKARDNVPYGRSPLHDALEPHAFSWCLAAILQNLWRRSFSDMDTQSDFSHLGLTDPEMNLDQSHTWPLLR